MTHQRFTEILPGGYTFDMCFVPSGSFDMGSDDDDKDAFNAEKPKRVGVQVSAFLLAPLVVTQKFWKIVMGQKSNPSRFKGDERPVESVSWLAAQEFIKILNELTKSNRENLGIGEYRLPTEAEWEYAARGGNLNARYRYVGSDKLKEVGWYELNSDEEIHDVGLLMPNQFGLFDMSGNVWEWMEDHWHENYEDAPLDGRAWLTMNSDAPRLIRGGSYYRAPQFCRTAYRNYRPIDFRYVSIGFRLAMSIPDMLEL